MIKYYPLNRVKTNQKTSGGEFLLDGKSYKGPYYSTYDGKNYTGPDPVTGPSELLTVAGTAVSDEIGGPDQIDRTITNKTLPTYENLVYNNVVTPNLAQLQTFQVPQPYYPQPTDADYKRGSILRYFAKKRDRAGFIIEINKDTHDSLKNTDSVYDYVTYEAISSFWQISGPLNDDRVNKQYKVAGIIDTNKRLIEAKEPGFPGLVAYIGGDYAKYAKPSS